MGYIKNTRLPEDVIFEEGKEDVVTSEGSVSRPTSGVVENNGTRLDTLVIDWITAEMGKAILQHENTMFDRDVKGQREDNPMQACSCLFARHDLCAVEARTPT